jgi:tetratricopeptide (TPR) repeat protein
MKKQLIAVAIICAVVIVLGCSGKSNKVPITTSSKAALENFLKGRSLAENLQGQEAIAYYQKAVEEDSNFAMAYLNLSFVVPSAKGFFANYNKALELVDGVSDGERLILKATEAGVNGDPMKQQELLQELIELYPKDERAHVLLGTFYYGLQEWEKAVDQFQAAKAINPDFAPLYNMLGYSNREMKNYSEAESAFKKYIELIPNDPNPYDSYAELLLKLGRFDESIQQYKKALEVNPNFVASHVGIATNLNYMNKHQEARDQLVQLYNKARNDGERRTALLAMAVSYVDEGKLDEALSELYRRYVFAEKISDNAAMSADHNLIGNIYLEMGDAGNALSHYQQARDLIVENEFDEQVKEQAQEGFLFNSARVDLLKNDVNSAKEKYDELLGKAKEKNDPTRLRTAHQLGGMIALAEADYDRAIEELQQANLQSAYNLYRLAQAYEGKGDADMAKEYYERAAKSNSLNSMDYAFIRMKADKTTVSL